MERRLLLAIVLTFIVLTAYQWLVPTIPPAPAGAPASAGTQPAQAPGAVPQPPAATAQPAAPVPTPVETIQADTTARSVTVDNGVVRAVFSNRGATLSAWQLTGYEGSGGQVVDLVPHDVPADQPRPFSL